MKEENQQFNESNIQIKTESNDKSQEAYRIIEYLTKEFGGNVSDNGVVKVTASSTNCDLHAKNAVDIHNKRNYFRSQNSKNSWLKYDFINRKVLPTGYAITTRHNFDGYHPRNWTIEGSNDDNDWEILDTRQNETSLTGLSVTCTFDIKSQKGTYRYLRIRQTGKNSDNSDSLILASLDFIGVLS